MGLEWKANWFGKVWEALWNLEVLYLFYHPDTKREHKLLFLTRMRTQQWGASILPDRQEVRDAASVPPAGFF